MPKRAKVSSVDEITRFRAHLVIYVKKAGTVLDEVHDEVLRARMWIEGEQRSYWEREVRKRAQALNEAQSLLSSARMSSLRESTESEQLAVNRARRALRDAEEKLAVTKKWGLLFGSRVESLLNGLSGLRGCLDHDLPNAIASLAKVEESLEAYRSLPVPMEQVSGGAASQGAAADEAPPGVAAPGKDRGQA